MDTIDAIKARRACRSWTDMNVPDDILETILTCGRFAPSPLNVQPWKFIVVKDRTMIDKLMQNAHHGDFLSLARVLIVATVTMSPDVDLWMLEHQQHILSAACALENMWIAATDLGLGGCWVTLNSDTTKDLLHIPTGQMLIGCLALGYPNSSLKVHKSTDRTPLRDLVYYEEWGGKK